jgi:signal transduction histidine kinase/ligand-binding sensor domain-containing protein/CheY-like chemotaxis protein
MRRNGGSRTGLAAWLLLAAGAAGAQVPETPLFRTLGTAEGLPSNNVYQLAQDRAGHLWIATGDGLARYDGVGFRVWQHDPAAPDSLPANNVQALHIDAADRLWLGTEGGGLSLMAPDRGGFRSFRPATDPRFALDDVWSIASTPDGALWFGGFGGGLHRYDPQHDRLQVFRHDPQQSGSLASDHVLALAVDAQGMLWVGGNQGLDRYVEGRFEHLGAGADGLSSPLVLSLVAERDGPLWIGTGAGLDRLAGGQLERLPLQAQLGAARVTALLRDRRGARWVAMHGGLAHLTAAGARRHLQFGNRRNAPTGSVFYDVLEDHEGGLWFASLGSGLQRLPPNWRNFAVLVAADAAAGGLSSHFPRGLAEAADGSLWVVGAGGALDRVARDGGVTRLLHGEQALPERNLWSVLEAADGAVWIGRYAGLTRYDPAHARLQHWDAQAGRDAVPSGPIDLLAAAPDGTLWLSANGVGLQHRAADGRVLATFAAGAGSGLAAGDTEAIQFAPDGTLWVAGGGGLFRRAPGAPRFEAVPGAPPQRVYGFDFEPDGAHLWLQRLGALERYRIGAGGVQRVLQIGAAEGLPPVEAGGLRLDAKSEVWLSSARGLVRYRPASGELRRYGVRDGLPSAEFANRPPLRLRDGTLAAGTVEGLVWFDPVRLEQNRSVPRLRFEAAGVRRGGAARTLDPRTPLYLQHDDRELRVSARLLSFADPAAHRYRFRLVGYERDWVDGGASGDRSFSQLPPGDYTLQAVAANGDGVWSAPPLALAISVAPPWWSTGPSRLGFAAAGLLLLALAALAYRTTLRRRHAQQLAQRQFEWTRRASEAKSSFLATLGHEIRTPMTGVLGMAELLLRTPLAPRQRDYADAIQRSGELLLRLVNDALDLARIEAGRLELDAAPVELAALLREVAEFQRPLAEQKGLRLQLREPLGGPHRVQGDALRLKQILLNLVGNAIKFTEQGEVELALEGEGDAGFVFEVCDTGPGLNEEQRARLFRRFAQGDGAQTAQRYGGSGLGLAICQELARAMGGRIEVRSEPGQGTSFRVHLALPVLAQAPDGAPFARDDIAAAAPERLARPLRLLLVEDDATVAAVVQGLLLAQGHAVVHAPHGLAALTALAGDRFDLALLDLDLPGLSGCDLARMIRTQGHDLPLLALTARTDPVAEPQARAAGMSGFLRKPVTGRALAAAVAEGVPSGGG